jgi:hypothetical protein
MAKKQPSKENPELLRRGQKQRSGKLLSEYLRAVAQEIDQVIVEDVPPGCAPAMPRLVSKAEALARWLWKRSLPSKDDEGNYMPPDLDIVKIVLDRCEGKPGIQGNDDSERAKESVPDKVSRMNAERLNQMAEDSVE